MTPHLDEAVQNALAYLLGKTWREKLQGAVSREMAGEKHPPKVRISEERRELLRQRFNSLNAARRRPEDAVAEEEALRAACRERMAAEGLSYTRAAEVVGVTLGRFSPWITGAKRSASTAEKARAWMAGNGPAEVAARRQATRAQNKAAAAALDMTDPALSAEEQHEARERLRKGDGPSELAEWFGGGLGWWGAWCEAQAMGRAA